VIKIAYVISAAALLFSCSSEEPAELPDNGTWNTLDGNPPLIIAHRGASAYLPGHTLEAYELGIDQGADYIEPDLVLTKDDVLICRHDRFLSESSNVADVPAFADRQAEKEGRLDWWVEDFTLAEIKSLRSREDYDYRSKDYDDKYEIPSFDEVIALAKRKSLETGREIGIYPEPKQAEQFQAMGKDIADALVRWLGWRRCTRYYPVV